MNEDLRYELARKRARALRVFYIHVATFVLVNLWFLILDWVTSPPLTWFYWPMIVWGVALIGHALSVFGSERWFGLAWEEQKTRELMDEEERRRNRREP